MRSLSTHEEGPTRRCSEPEPAGSLSGNSTVSGGWLRSLTYAFACTMNKWQIICPVALLLIVALWMGHAHFQTEEKIMRAAIDRHLGLVLAGLEAHQDAG